MNYSGGMWEGGGGQDGVEWGGEWDNCNSIINKYIKNKKMSAFFKKRLISLLTYKGKKTEREKEK